MVGTCNESVPELAIDLRIRGWWAEPVGISKVNVADIPSRHLQLVEHVGPSVKASPLPGRSSLHFDCDRTVRHWMEKTIKTSVDTHRYPPIIHFIFVFKKINPSILGYPQPYGKKTNGLYQPFIFGLSIINHPFWGIPSYISYGHMKHAEICLHYPKISHGEELRDQDHDDLRTFQLHHLWPGPVYWWINFFFGVGGEGNLKQIQEM